MTTSPIAFIARGARPLAVAALTAFAGCASVDRAAAPPSSSVRQASSPPQPAAAGTGRTVTDFSAARRCMDGLLLDHGTRDLTVIVEDAVDKSKSLNAGTRDMLIASVSEMTQRSRAIRLVASGEDWGRTTAHMTQTLKREPLAVVPQYALRGSISPLDERNAQRGATPGSAASVLALDLTLLATQDMGVVPGTASRNEVAVFDGGAGRAGRAELRKLGVHFEVALGADDGRAQAARALVELASIELVGRLAKVPYWTCLGANGDNTAVASEIQDWYDVMATRPAEIITYFQAQLRTRGVYDGPIDGAVNPQFKDGVARYRAALGLSREPKLSLEFFRAYLNTGRQQVEARVPPASAALAAAPAPVAPAAQGAEPVVPLTLRVATGNDGNRFGRGEPVRLTIHPNRDAHVYCYLQDEDHKIMRFFPNRFRRDSRVEPAAGLQLPGAMRFEIVLNPRGAQETVSCFATERDVLAQLPAGMNAGDFDPLSVASLDQLRGAFAKAAGGALAQESLQLRPK